MPRPIHIGQPPSRCQRAEPTSAWHPTEGTCQHCTGEWAPPAPHTRSPCDDEWAAALLDLRLRLDRTQQEMADLFGVSRPTVVHWERRTTKVQRAMLFYGRVMAETEKPG